MFLSRTQLPKLITISLLLISVEFSLAQHYTFPLGVSSNKRYLVDAKGKPFLYVSDSGWELLFGLDLNDTRKYFLKRKQQGFSVVHIMLTGFPDKDYPKSTHLPFHNFDLTQPNEKFFSYADKVVALADSCNVILAIAPLWYSCCNDGWSSNPKKYMKKAGIKGSTEFGEYIGNRYKNYNNILWIMGGDNDPGENRGEVKAFAEAIKKAAPHQPITYHAASTHSSTDVWDNEQWLDVSMTYTYFRGFHKAWNYVQPDIYEVNYSEYKKYPIRPFLIGESTYENEHTDVTDTKLQVRKQAYYAMLSGACGHSYGSPFWNIGSAAVQADWQKIIDLPGANSLKYLNALFETFNWETLIPDMESKLIVSGNNRYATNDYAVAAITTDRQRGIIYLPSFRKIGINFSPLAGEKINTSWYNPRTGELSFAGTYNKKLNQEFTPPTSVIGDDWVLILDDASKKYSSPTKH